MCSSRFLSCINSDPKHINNRSSLLDTYHNTTAIDYTNCCNALQPNMHVSTVALKCKCYKFTMDLLLETETSLNSTNHGFENGISPRPTEFNIYVDFVSTFTLTGISTTVPTTVDILEVM